MCTVTYVPLAAGSIITANRDESPLRNAGNLTSYQNQSGTEYLIAKEPVHGGTNIAFGRDYRTAVLLNGAFERHQIGGWSGISRGLVVLDSLNYPDLFTFAEAYDFKGIEPFTLIHFSDRIQEIRWNGTLIFKKSFDGKSPKIWASAQLYAHRSYQ